MPTSRPIALIGALALIASVAAHDLVASRQAQVPPGRQQQPTVPAVSYDVDVTLVEVDAVVTDEQGRVIRDLRADEFQVLEDGTPQTIDRVSFVEIPIEREREAREPTRHRRLLDVHTNLHRFDGRLYVLLLDDLHTATVAQRPGEGGGSPVHRGEPRARLTWPRSCTCPAPPGAGQGFTSDRAAACWTSVERFSGRKLRSETLNLIDKYNEQLQLTGRHARAPERHSRSRRARPRRRRPGRVRLDCSHRPAGRVRCGAVARP